LTPGEIKKLERKVGYQFQDSAALVQAVTHRSFASHNNERLEFLGDGILNFIIAEALYLQFPEATEGQLSRLRALMVKQKTLAAIAREMSLGDFLVMGIGELKSGGFNRDSILSDALEAIVAAVYREAGFESTRTLLLSWFVDRLSSLSLDQTLKDPKSRLQEYLQSRKEALPNYEVVSIEGEAHQQTFTIQLSFRLLEPDITAVGSSRRNAEQHAAEAALIKIGVDTPHE
jgi:ribonuclease-3